MLLLSACVAALLSGRAECLVARGPDGQIALVEIGAVGHVDIPPALDTILLTPGQRISLLHNHPQSLGLSDADLLQLCKAGVASVEAISNDGARYRGARGPRFDADRFALVLRRAIDLAPRYLNLVGLPPDEQSSLRREGNHLVCLALADAGVIEYRAQLSAAHGVWAREAARCQRARADLGAVLRHMARDRL